MSKISDALERWRTADHESSITFHRDQVISLLDELRSGGEGKDGVAVKPLEWEKHPTAEMYRAMTMLGSYQAIAMRKTGWMYDGFSGEETSEEGLVSIEAAKAAAQADYERRILSALTNTEPSLRAENERLRKDLNGALRASEVLNLTLEEAVKVLEPFADTADHDIGLDEHDSDTFRPMTSHNSAAKITVGNMRAAKSFLSNLKGAE